MSYIQFELTIFPNFFGKHKEKVDHMLRFALKLFAQVRILNWNFIFKTSQSC